MMKVKFVGNFENPPESLETAYGLAFEKGKWADTADLPPNARANAEAKFGGNPYFEVKGEDDPEKRGPGRPKKDDPEPLPQHPAVATPADGAVEDPRGKQEVAGDKEAPKGKH